VIAVQVNTAGFVRAMKRLTSAVARPRAVMAAAGRAGANELKRHYREKDKTEPNKLGGKRTHFWLAVSRAVQAPITSDTESRISINHPAIAQKVRGGPIVPKRAKALTIPVAPEAYGRRASTFEAETGLKLFVFKKDNCAFLAAADGKGVRVYYVLSQGVNQLPDPTAMPEPRRFQSVILRAAASAMRRQLQNPGGATT